MNKVDQSKLAQSVAEKIQYEFNREFLVKPLPIEKVKKEFTTPVSTGKHEDKDGIEANDYDEVKTEVKEVGSDFMKPTFWKPISSNRSKTRRYVNIQTLESLF